MLDAFFKNMVAACAVAVKEFAADRGTAVDCAFDDVEPSADGFYVTLAVTYECGEVQAYRMEYVTNDDVARGVELVDRSGAC